MTAKACTAREAGLTLVELLVALAVLALVAGLLVTGLHSAATGWPRIVRGNADNEDRQATRRMLSHLLAQIHPARLDRAGGGFVQFAGERDRMDFLAPLARRFGTDDIVRYALRSGADGLRVAWRLDRPAAAGEEDFIAPAAEDIVPDWRAGAFAYYGAAEAGGETQWWTRWKERKTLPLLIRLQFVSHGRAEELVAAPLITAGACSASVANAVCQE
jgi:prepilin-type N-terminal cleavage/methylation domain-containing protein